MYFNLPVFKKCCRVKRPVNRNAWYEKNIRLTCTYYTFGGLLVRRKDREEKPPNRARYDDNTRVTYNYRPIKRASIKIYNTRLNTAAILCISYKNNTQHIYRS